MRIKKAIYKGDVFPEIKNRTGMVRKYIPKQYERKDIWLFYRMGVWYSVSEEFLKFL